MNEVSWLSSNDPQEMLLCIAPSSIEECGRHGVLGPSRLVTERKLRLFAKEWRRMAFGKNVSSPENIEFETPESVKELWGDVLHWCRNLVTLGPVHPRLQANLISHIFGNSWLYRLSRTVIHGPGWATKVWVEMLPASGLITDLAQAAYYLA